MFTKEKLFIELNEINIGFSLHERAKFALNNIKRY